MMIDDNFLIFVLKYRLWVFVRKASVKQCQQSMFFSQNKKNNEHPGKPHFFVFKVGFSRLFIAWTCLLDAKFLIYENLKKKLNA